MSILGRGLQRKWLGNNVKKDTSDWMIKGLNDNVVEEEERVDRVRRARSMAGRSEDV